MLNESALLTSLLTSMSIMGDQRKEGEKALYYAGIDAIFNEQTPVVEPVVSLTEESLKIYDEMLLFVKFNRYLRLAGMAANQVAKNGERIDLSACYINRDHSWIIALNPCIVDYRGSSRTSREGCLTWPDKKIVTVRHEEITVSYTDLRGALITEDVSGFEAIVWQHEVNHLLGIPENVIDPEIKLKPNDKCHCGSSRKFKKCCGR